jgi:Ni,Fe-hydrogenase III large subunit
MTQITKKGYELAFQLNRYIGTTHRIAETCSLIARHATTYAWIQERWCNVEMPELVARALEAKEDRLKARITDLVNDLPWTEHGQIRVQFDGDPRAYVVRLLVPDENYRGTREIGVA